jgi:hypothetical protein
VNMEMRHDSRMIPISTRQHLPSNVRLWLGDPVGKWEGDTFVVDSTNFRTGAAGGRGSNSDKLHMIEKFSRVGPDALKYEVTINDPDTYTAPWTAVLYMKQSKDQIYEYACHEGNEAMSGTLGGARVQERNAKVKNTSSR